MCWFPGWFFFANFDAKIALTEEIRTPMWSIRSKALEKSIMHVRMITRWVSEEESQWCKRWISRCVVEQPLMLPKWFLSIFEDRTSYIHLKTKLSKILLNTGVKEIGRRSLPASFGLLTLCKGRTFAHYIFDTFPGRWENWANWSSKYGEVSYKCPVWYVVRADRFLKYYFHGRLGSSVYFLK